MNVQTIIGAILTAFTIVGIMTLIAGEYVYYKERKRWRSK